MTQPLRQTRLRDDDWLGRLVTGGDREAFAVLYERYHGPLYRYCRSILWNDADAHDAVQSTFTRALGALQENQRDAPVRPWLFRIAHNEAVSVLRSSKARDLAIGQLARQAKAVEDPTDEREELGSLFADLAQLPERARAAIVLRELIGLSHDEIAVALGTTVSNAKHAIFEARRALTEFATGRRMECLEVRRAFAHDDHRTLRSRRVRAHLRNCAACARFAALTYRRSPRLRAVLSVPGITKELLAPGALLEMADVAQGPLATAGIFGGLGSKILAGLIAAKEMTVTGTLVAGALAIGMGYGLNETMQPAATPIRSASPAHGTAASDRLAEGSAATPTASHVRFRSAAPDGVWSGTYPLRPLLLGVAQTLDSPGSALVQGADGDQPASGRAGDGTTDSPRQARTGSGAALADAGAGQASTEHRSGAGGAARGRPDPAMRSNPAAWRRSSARQMGGSRSGAGGAPRTGPSATTNHGRVSPGSRAGGNPSNRAGGDPGNLAGGSPRSEAEGNPGTGAGNRGRGNSAGGAGGTSASNPVAAAPPGRPIVTPPAEPSELSPSAVVPPGRSPEPSTDGPRRIR